MSKASHLPARWRSEHAVTRHNEAIADILETPPILHQNEPLVLCARVGTAQVLAFLVAIKSLRARLGRGRIAVLDDGTLTAQDRAILAHHCGDPEIIRLREITTAPFPKTDDWASLLTVLERREREYWLQVDCASVTLGPLPEIATAIARNRSFVCLANGSEGGPQKLSSLIDAPLSTDGKLAQIEASLAQMPGAKRWHYARIAPGLTGFNASSGGRALADMARQAMQAAAPDSARDNAANTMPDGPDHVRAAANFVLANERHGDILPDDRYVMEGEGENAKAAFFAFPTAFEAANEAFIRASRLAIDALKV